MKNVRTPQGGGDFLDSHCIYLSKYESDQRSASKASMNLFFFDFLEAARVIVAERRSWARADCWRRRRWHGPVKVLCGRFGRERLSDKLSDSVAVIVRFADGVVVTLDATLSERTSSITVSPRLRYHLKAHRLSTLSTVSDITTTFTDTTKWRIYACMAVGRAFSVDGPDFWNSMRDNLRNPSTVSNFLSAN